MIEENIARLRAHRNNIQRSRQLLETRLTDLERQFIEKRLSEEQLALETLAASTYPLTSPTGAGDVALPRSADAVAPVQKGSPGA